MKKVIILLVVLLLTVAVTGAQAFFMIADPLTTEGAAKVVIPVYNNSGGALDEGDVVVWDIGSSTGDNDLYVTTTTTAATGLVAGVVTKGGIGAGSSGSIVVYGMAECDHVEGGAGTQLCTSTTAGAGGICSTTALESMSYAIVSALGSSGQSKCFVGGK